MYEILKQLQGDIKEVSLLIGTDAWLTGHICFINEEYLTLEAIKNEKEDLYVTTVIKLSAIIAVEFTSDLRISQDEKFYLPWSLAKPKSAPEDNIFNDDDLDEIN